MWQNYFKTSFRNFLNNRTYTLINISGLSLGILTCVLIALFVWDEKSYDTFVPEHEKIFRLYSERKGNDSGRKMAVVSPMFKPTLQSEFPEVDTTMRIINFFGKTSFKVDDKVTYEKNGIFAEAQFFNFFGLTLKEGDESTALKEINTVVLSEKLAKKYFPNKNPIGETLIINDREAQVTGVLDALPGNFHLKIDFLSSFATVESFIKEERMQDWVWQQFYTYVKINQEDQKEILEEKFQAFVVKNIHPITNAKGFTYIPYLQPLNEIHLHSYNFEWDIAQQGNINYVNALSWVAIFILVIACINFINLATARAVKRAKEVGVRKTAGAHKIQLIAQFLIEAFLLVFISTIIGGFLVEIILPYLNNFSDKSLSFNPFTSYQTFFGFVSFILLITLLSGIYPALVIANLSPLTAIKQQKSGHLRTSQLRKILVVLQFAISTLVLVVTIIIYQQLNFLQKKDYGFQKERLLSFPISGDKMEENLEDFKNSLLAKQGVENVSSCYGIPGDIVAGDNVFVPNLAAKLPVNLFIVDQDYTSALGLEILHGRDFKIDSETDVNEAFIINETAVKAFGFENAKKAIGQPLHWDMWYAENEMKKGVIIGVVKDFHFNSLHQKVEPVVLHIYPRSYSFILARIGNKNNIPNTLKGIKELWEDYVPEKPFDYQFIDSSFDNAYKAEQKLGKIFLLFSIISVFIACFGLFGLVAFSTEQRRKELGIRKVLGAGEIRLMLMLVKQLSNLVVLAACIALPIGYYFSQYWLQAFAYSIPINILPFAASMLLILSIAWLTVGYHALNAALEKPVHSLRSE